MSAQLRSRALQEGRVKALLRMKQPMAQVLATSACSPDSIARVFARPGGRGAGRHIPSRGAQRRADRMALQALLRQEDWE